MSKSDLEEDLAWQIKIAGLPEPKREYRFHHTRKWRADFAWPEFKLIAEVEGGVWNQGRHVRGKGFIDDCEKCNEAATLGWTVLRFPEMFISDGRALEWLERIINDRRVK